MSSKPNSSIDRVKDAINSRPPLDKEALNTKNLLLPKWREVN